jgi:hypothetical protein
VFQKFTGPNYEDMWKKTYGVNFVSKPKNGKINKLKRPKVFGAESVHSSHVLTNALKNLKTSDE